MLIHWVNILLILLNIPISLTSKPFCLLRFHLVIMNYGYTTDRVGIWAYKIDLYDALNGFDVKHFMKEFDQSGAE